MSSIHIADTGVFVAIGQPSNRRYRARKTFARRNDIVFVVTQRVYDELTINDSELSTPPIAKAIANAGGSTLVVVPTSASRNSWYHSHALGPASSPSA